MASTASSLHESLGRHAGHKDKSKRREKKINKKHMNKSRAHNSNNNG
jgi:hypothetical protein